MPLFDAENRLRTDECSTSLWVTDNVKNIDYSIMNLREFECSEKNHVKNFANEHRNLRPWDGYGMDTSVIDQDSAYRYDASRMTHWKCRQQLQNRLFQAIPLLQRGTVLPGLESRMWSGNDTSHIKECDRLGEKMYDVFHPNLTDVMDTSGCRIGLKSSRDIARSKEFLESMGYTHNGRVWQRSS